jgi:hypothetical protein
VIARATFATIAIAVSATAQASTDVEPMAACMWAKMPTSAAAFADNSDKSREFSLMMKAATPCADQMPTNMNLNRLRKVLLASRPAAIGPDLSNADNASVCERLPDGKLGPCKQPGE